MLCLPCASLCWAGAGHGAVLASCSLMIKFKSPVENTQGSFTCTHLTVCMQMRTQEPLLSSQHTSFQTMENFLGITSVMWTVRSGTWWDSWDYPVQARCWTLIPGSPLQLRIFCFCFMIVFYDSVIFHRKIIFNFPVICIF